MCIIINNCNAIIFSIISNLLPAPLKFSRACEILKSSHQYQLHKLLLQVRLKYYARPEHLTLYFKQLILMIHIKLCKCATVIFYVLRYNHFYYQSKSNYRLVGYTANSFHRVFIIAICNYNSCCKICKFVNDALKFSRVLK